MRKQGSIGNVPCVPGREIDLMVVKPEARHRHEEGKIIAPAIAEDIEIEALGAGVKVGEHQA